MTSKQLYEGIFTEVIKETSPNLHVREFNYYANEAIFQFVNNAYETFQSGKGNLNFLKALKKYQVITTFTTPSIGVFSFPLPQDYRSLESLSVFLTVNGPIIDTCYPVGTVQEFGSSPFDFDRKVALVQDSFMKPRYFRPYHDIIDAPTTNFNAEVHMDGNVGLLVTSPYQLTGVRMNYLKLPEVINLTQPQLINDAVDTSQVLEFDDVTSRKIRQLLILMILERNSNPRAATYNQVVQTRPVPGAYPIGQAPA